jgi:hypothetical protein
MTVRRFVVPVTTASGSATEYTPAIYGHIESIRYVKGDFADTVDFTITAETTGETIWAEENVTASATRHPRAATHSVAGAASLYASGGTAVNGKIALGGDRVKIVIANGGDAKTGTFHITVDG